MDLVKLATAAAVTSIVLLVLALGLRSSMADALYVLRRPALLLRSLLAMNVLMPLLIFALATSFNLRPAVEIALFALALSPVPPILPGKQLKLVTHEGYVLGLLVASAVASVVLAPLAIELADLHLGMRARVEPLKILEVVARSVILPLLVGILFHHLRPELAKRLARPVNVAGGVLLLVVIVPALLSLARTIFSLVGDGTLLAIVVFTVLGLLIGHWLGGPEPDNRTALALATATRHPGVALTVATAAFPNQKLVLPAIVLFMLVNLIASMPYSNWRKRQRSRAPAAAAEGD
jgi:BASS family bile acid:Na+ symporter